jgi:tRNA threonylcarbamoyladenosine biosynthesis protein TsaE
VTTLRSDSPEATRAIAELLALAAVPGDLIVLAGDMGAGKTCFAQGFARGLSITDRVTSPTFTLVNSYEGRFPMHHLDVYRLDQLHEVLDLGLGELLDDGSVVLIEWGDAVSPVLPNEYLEVRLAADPDDDNVRAITIVQVGSLWAQRLHDLQQRLSEWSC